MRYVIAWLYKNEGISVVSKNRYNEIVVGRIKRPSDSSKKQRTISIPSEGDTPYVHAVINFT